MEKERRALRLLFVLFFGLLITRYAWVSDDAMITFRPVENFLAGYGLGFNPFVRVQVFTHPLWMLLLSAVYYVALRILPQSPDTLIHISMLLSIGISCLAVYLLASRLTGTRPFGFVLPLLILSLSSAFVDYSTSGLENPLTHLLLVLFVWAFWRDAQNLFLLSFLSALIALNRLDALLLTLPALGYAFWLARTKRRALLHVATGFLPLLAWEAFSLFYFGFPFPNTAYAKLSTGIPDSLMLRQGLDYLLNSINWDPLTFFAIGLAALVLYLTPERRGLALYAGVGLYVLYVVRIGGDFMSGRFLTAPLFLAVTVLAVCGIPRSLGRLALALVVLLGVFTLRSPLWSSNMLTTFPNYPLLDRNGISDQRLFYFGNPNENQYNSFVENGFRNGDYGSAFAGEGWQFQTFKRVLVTRALGKIGYQEGPNIYVIDEFALADPLLARLPVLNRYWQIGHFHRDLPEGYMETLQSGSNQIVDPDLALYYDRLDVVIRRPLFSWERMREIWKFNTGGYDSLLERYNSRTER